MYNVFMSEMYVWNHITLNSTKFVRVNKCMCMFIITSQVETASLIWMAFGMEIAYYNLDIIRLFIVKKNEFQWKSWWNYKAQLNKN